MYNFRDCNLKGLSWLSMALTCYFITQTTHAAFGPRITGLGQIGEYGSLWGDGLFPTQDLSNQVTFFDFQVETNRFYSGNSFSGIVSPGLGIRHAFPNENVFGLYLFSDYMMTNVQQNYWFISPGVDFYHGPGFIAFNSYIPVNNAPRNTGSNTAASDMGITQYQILTGHSQYDNLIETFYTMRWGMDLSGGMLFGDNHEWEGKLGAYLYDSQNVDAIKGMRGEIDYYFNNHVALTIEDRYDNVFHNQTVIGLKINFMGTDNRGTVETQLKAPMYRNLNINTTNAGTPIGEYYHTTAESYLINNNITFVSNKSYSNSSQLNQPQTITGDGTYENPYTGLNQDILNHTTENTNIWVEGTGNNNPYADAATLTLQTGQAIYGRTNGFKSAASNPNTQPIFNFSPVAGTAALYIDNTNTLQNFIMLGNGSNESIGVHAIGTGGNQSAYINGVTIGSSTSANIGYSTAFYNQGGNVSINNSRLYALKDVVSATGDSQPQTYGIFGLYNDGGTIAVNNSVVTANAHQVIYNSTGPGGDLAGVFGVYNNQGAATLSNSIIQAISDNVLDNRQPSGSIISSIIGSFGLYNTNGTMVVNGSSSSITALATDVDNEGNNGSGQGLLDFVGAFGAYNDGGIAGNISTLNIKQAHLTTSASTVLQSSFSHDPTVAAVGVWNNGQEGTANTTIEQGAMVDVNATWQITNPTSSGSSLNAYGIYNESQGSSAIANLIADGVIVTATQTGGNSAMTGIVAGVMNGAFLSAPGGTAITLLKGASQVNAKDTGMGTGNQTTFYGFYNNGNYNFTNGTSIEGGSILSADGGANASASAIYNTIGNMTIQGTADQNITLIANGNGSNNGVWNDNLGNITIDYVTIDVGSSANDYSLGVNNTSGSSATIQHANVTVSSSSQVAFGVNNDATSTINIMNSIFNVSTESGTAYGLWDTGGGMSIASPSTLNLNFDTGTVYAFSSSGDYTGTGNVTCYTNGVQTLCPTS